MLHDLGLVRMGVGHLLLKGEGIMRVVRGSGMGMVDLVGYNKKFLTNFRINCKF